MEDGVRLEYPDFMLHIEVDREEDGRFIAEVVELPGVLAYGATTDSAVNLAAKLALQVMADRMQHGEAALPSVDDLRRPLSKFPMPANTTQKVSRPSAAVLRSGSAPLS